MNFGNWVLLTFGDIVELDRDLCIFVKSFDLLLVPITVGFSYPDWSQRERKTMFISTHKKKIQVYRMPLIGKQCRIPMSSSRLAGSKLCWSLVVLMLLQSKYMVESLPLMAGCRVSNGCWTGSSVSCDILFDLLPMRNFNLNGAIMKLYLVLCLIFGCVVVVVLCILGSSFLLLLLCGVLFRLGKSMRFCSLKPSFHEFLEIVFLVL